MNSTPPATPQPQLVTVASGVHAWIGAGGDSNAGAIETPDGLLIVDAQQYPRLARQFRDALKMTVDRPPVMLIDTHCHLDHTHGNVVFEDLPILAHEKTLTAMHAALGPRSGDRWSITDFPTKLRMLFGQNIMNLVPDGDPAQVWFKQRISLPDYDTVTILPPTQTFADHFTFVMAHETVHLDYWGPAHCDGDVVVHLEKAKVVFLGDLLFHGRFPWLGDCDLDGWIDRLARVLGLDVAVVIPGHGVPTDLNSVKHFRDMLIALRAAVAQAITSGWSEEAAVRDVHLPQYAGINRYSDWMPLDVKAAYRYLQR